MRFCLLNVNKATYACLFASHCLVVVFIFFSQNYKKFVVSVLSVMAVLNIGSIIFPQNFTRLPAEEYGIWEFRKHGVTEVQDKDFYGALFQNVRIIA